MATFSAVTREHILRAIAECDSRGHDDFVGVYGFGGAQGYPLVHEGRSYDSTAILGVAHRYATGRLATSDEVGGDPAGAALLLRKRGFVVTGPVADERVAGPSGPRARTTRSPARAAAPARRPAAAPERVAPICPTCSMTLPATGVCDDCG